MALYCTNSIVMDLGKRMLYVSHFYSSDSFISSPLLNTDFFLIYYLSIPSPPPSPPPHLFYHPFESTPYLFLFRQEQASGDNKIA